MGGARSVIDHQAEQHRQNGYEGMDARDAGKAHALAGAVRRSAGAAAARDTPQVIGWRAEQHSRSVESRYGDLFRCGDGGE